MAAKRIELKIRLDNLRCSFLKVFEADAMDSGDKPAFSGHFLFDPGDEENMAELKKLRQAMLKVAIGKWGREAGKRTLIALMKKNLTCLHNGNDKTDADEKVMEGYENKKFLSARSYVRPTVIGRGREPLSEEDGLLFSGCWVTVYVNLWAQTGKWGKRINAQLMGIQFVKTGDSFGGGQAADPGVFESLADEFDDDGDFTDFSDDGLEDASNIELNDGDDVLDDDDDIPL